MSRIITVTSGKGGVGKTNISVNLALYLASQGYRVCLFDADMGLANIDILMGLYPKHTLEDVLAGEKRLKDIIVRDCSGIDVIPGSSGVKRMADPEPGEIDLLIDALSELEDYDYFFFDTSAGISKNVASFCMASPEIILVVTPEPTSLTDAYSLLKVLSMNGFGNTVMVAINQCSNVQVASNIYTKFKKVVDKYLSINILPLGTIPSDPHVSEAVKQQKPFISLFPNTGVSRGVKNIARHMISKHTEDMDEQDLKDFWPKCFDILKSPLRLTTGGVTDEAPATEKEMKEGQDKGTGDIGGDLPISTGTAEGEISKGRDDYSQDMKPQPMSQDVQSLLQGIVKGISSISSELGAIRRIIEMDKGVHGKRDIFSKDMERAT